MATLFSLAEGLSQKANALNSALREQEWGSLPRQGIVAALQRSIAELEGILALAKEAELGVEKEAEKKDDALRLFAEELEKRLSFLRLNLDMEKKALQKPLPEKAAELVEEKKWSELYASLQQDILTLLLKARYQIERLQIIARKAHGLPLGPRSIAGNLLELLEHKESEIEGLRIAASEARKIAIAGKIDESDAAEIEKSLQENARRLESSIASLENSLSEGRKRIEAQQASVAEIQRKYREATQLFSNYVSKSLELVAVLKRERDFAKKTFLDIESEALQLRNTYSQRLLKLEEEKAIAKKEAEASVAAKQKRMEKELHFKQELLENLQKMVESREQKTAELEQKNLQLRLFLKTKRKHEAVRRHLRPSIRKSKR